MNISPSLRSYLIRLLKGTVYAFAYVALSMWMTFLMLDALLAESALRGF